MNRLPADHSHGLSSLILKNDVTKFDVRQQKIHMDYQALFSPKEKNVTKFDVCCRGLIRSVKPYFPLNKRMMSQNLASAADAISA